jgi:hypothetical protein
MAGAMSINGCVLALTTTYLNQAEAPTVPMPSVTEPHDGALLVAVLAVPGP